MIPSEDIDNSEPIDNMITLSVAILTIERNHVENKC